MVALSLMLSCGVAADASTVSIFINSQVGLSTEHTGAGAAITLDFEETAAGSLLDIAIENATPVEIGSRLTAVGLELPDALTAVPVFAARTTGEYFDTLTFDHSVSPGWLDASGGYDLMITSDGDFLGGNPNGAPSAGEVQTVTLDLGQVGVGAGEIADMFSRFYMAHPGNYAIARFQAVGPNGSGSDKVTGIVPEPATITLLALGAIALRRRA
jgi:hypothetical protein